MRRGRTVTAILALVLAGCTRSTPEPAPERAAPVSVTVATAATVDLSDGPGAGGVVVARTVATLAARVPAPVTRLLVRAGDRVRAGQPLVLLDGTDLSQRARAAQAAGDAAGRAVEAAAADERAAQAGAALAQATFRRVEVLHASRSATAQELDQSTAALREAEARVAAAGARRAGAEASVDAARAAEAAAATTASFAEVTAPFAGVIVRTFVDVGDMAGPGAPLVRLEGTSGYRLEVRLEAARLGGLTVGQHVPVEFDNTLVQGTVEEIGRAVEVDDRAALVKIALPEVVGLRSGLFGRARVGDTRRRGLAVPEQAIVHRGQVTSVFVVEQGVARVRLVRLSGTEVVAGLADGETVVIAPPPGLTDGAPVRVGGGR